MIRQCGLGLPQAFVEKNTSEFIGVQSRAKRLTVHQRLVTEDVVRLTLIRLVQRLDSKLGKSQPGRPHGGAFPDREV